VDALRDEPLRGTLRRDVLLKEKLVDQIEPAEGFQEQTDDYPQFRNTALLDSNISQLLMNAP
jgi:hypothetical protein